MKRDEGLKAELFLGRLDEMVHHLQDKVIYMIWIGVFVGSGEARWDRYDPVIQAENMTMRTVIVDIVVIK